jgi:hypothetical protein
VDRDPINWLQAEPGRVVVEREAMADRAPQMEWFRPGKNGFQSGGFEGDAPEWPIDRNRPKKLDELTEGKRLRLRVELLQGFPAQPPRLVPLDPEPEIAERLTEAVHVNSDGSLCMIRHPSQWRTTDLAVDLVEKASGWFIEYLAVRRELITEMSRSGIFVSTDLDQRIEGL